MAPVPLAVEMHWLAGMRRPQLERDAIVALQTDAPRHLRHMC